MRIRHLSLAMVTFLSLCASSRAVTVTYDGFASTAGLTLNASAATVVTGDGTVLRLSPAAANRNGSAFSSEVINAADFSTYFRFRITNPGGTVFDCNTVVGADGLAFVVQAVSNSIGGIGQGIGYAGIGTSVISEWDTWCNAANNDPSSNHVGININGNPNHGAGSPFTAVVAPDFDDGEIWHGWVDYDGTTLEVRTNKTGSRPAAPTVSRVIDVPTTLGGVDEAYVGFTSATGADWGNHDLIYWEYRSEFAPIPEPSSVILAGLGGLALMLARRRRTLR
ncbi:MAG: hypothetical protein DCC68_07880 [Planctomycetota bacterium]|nr:MAG: hypothetical protein DCC68_07880 [Planctomycetota bacterium]